MPGHASGGVRTTVRTPPEQASQPELARSAGAGTYAEGAVFRARAGAGRSKAALPQIWTTATRCAFGNSGSSTSLLRSSGPLVSNTTGRSSSSAVAATTASMAQRWPDRPVAPSNSPARRAISAVTGTTVILESTRCTAASRAPPLRASVKVIALTATRARRARAVSRWARARASPAASFESPSLSRTSVPPTVTRRPATQRAPAPDVLREQVHARRRAIPTARPAGPVRAGGSPPRSRTG